MLSLTVLSAAFVMGSTIPPPYVCGAVSPPLSWSKVPEETKSIAILCDDPDAPIGDWVHWVLFNLPPDTQSLDAEQPRDANLPNGAVQGINDYRRNGYDGPCPPAGSTHRYYFKVYALDTMLNLGPKTRKPDLLKAMEGHILAKGELMGKFGR